MKRIRLKGYWDVIFLDKDNSPWPIPVYHPSVGEFTTTGCYYDSSKDEWVLSVRDALKIQDNLA